MYAQDEVMEERREFIGASDAPVILGVSPWKTPYQLWLEKIGFGKPHETTYAQERGLRLEEPALKRFEEMTGIVMVPQQKRSHPQYPWMRATFDGISFCGKYAVEIKCPGKEDHMTAVQGHVPDKYYPQIQHQWAIDNFEMIFYFSFDGQDGILLETSRDQDYITQLIQEESAFWDCVQTLKAPKLTHRDCLEQHDANWLSLVDRWKLIHSKIEELEAQEDLLREEIIQRCGDVSSQGNGVRVRKMIRKGEVQYNKIPELKSVDLEQYRKEPTQYWKFSIE